MLDLLIAILISLGCYVKGGVTIEELQKIDADAYEKAKAIYESGNYKTDDGGGIVIVETGGD